MNFSLSLAAAFLCGMVSCSPHVCWTDGVEGSPAIRASGSLEGPIITVVARDRGAQLPQQPNTLEYDTKRDRLLFTDAAGHGIFAVDRATGNALEWKLCRPGDGVVAPGDFRLSRDSGRIYHVLRIRDRWGVEWSPVDDPATRHEIVAQAPGHITAIVLSPDERTLYFARKTVSWSEECTLSRVDLQTGAMVKFHNVSPKFAHAITDLEMCPDGQRLYIAANSDLDTFDGIWSIPPDDSACAVKFPISKDVVNGVRELEYRARFFNEDRLYWADQNATHIHSVAADGSRYRRENPVAEKGVESDATGLEIIRRKPGGPGSSAAFRKCQNR